ncbi:MAG: FG-GAP-like repeat-containing protein [Planctomycetota bacterium]
MVPLLCVSAARAQDLLWRLEGNGSLIGRGREIYRLGDANGDGWEDLIEWGEVYEPTSPYLRRNAIFVTSGRDGSVLSASPAFPNWDLTFQPLSLAPTGDMDQDGVPDYAVTVYDSLVPYNTQHVEVRSGATHAVLWTATIPSAWSNWYGWSLAGDMDLDGDGLRDLVVNATQFSPNGTIFVYDHFGNERYRLIDSVPGVLTGTDLAPLGGDMDGDGCDDFLSAGPDALNRGAVVVFSGLTGTALRVSHGVQNGDKLSFATGCGDMDGDGVLDYAGGGFWGASVVTAFSGATGQPIHTWRAPAYPYMGANVFGGFDLDQDGVNDLVAGSDGSAAHALSGRDGTFLWTYPNSHSSSGIGLYQTMIAPPPGQTYPIMIYSEATWTSITNPATIMLPGLLWAYRGAPRGVRTFGRPDVAPGFAPPRIGMRDVPGPPVRLTLSSAPASMPALLLLGLSDSVHGALALPAPLDPFGMSSMTLLTSAEALSLAWTGATGMATGFAQNDLLLPPGRSLGLTGLPVFAQWLWFDPANLAIGGSTAGQRFFVQ